MPRVREDQRRGHRPHQRTGLRLVLVGFTALGCGHLGIDLDPRDFDLSGDGKSSGGSESGGSGSATSSGGEENLGGAQMAGGAEGTGARGGNWGGGGRGGGGDWGGGGRGGDWGGGGDWGSGGALVESDCSTGTFGTHAMIDTLDVAGDKWGPTITGDRLVLYFAVTSTDTETIYRATRSAKDQPFGAATEVTELNAIARQGTPFVNEADTRIYFFRQSTSDQASRDLWYASRTSPDEPFSGLTALTAINSSYRDLSPWLSRDERTIYFASSRGTEEWETDIWTANRPSTSAPFEDLTMVSELDQDASEDQAPSLTPDGLTMFFTTDLLTSLDVYSVKRNTKSDPFGTPTREDGLSSSAEDVDLSLSSDGREIFISSDRSGNYEIWSASRDCD